MKNYVPPSHLPAKDQAYLYAFVHNFLEEKGDYYNAVKTAEAVEKAAEKKIAEANVEIARLEKEAELEKQQSYTDEYFRDKELDVQKAAVEAINPSIKTVITSGDGEGYEAIFGLKEIFGATE